MRQYYEMKESNIEWLKVIPKDWSLYKIKFLLKNQLLYGATETGDSENVDGIRYIRITDIDQDGNLTNDNPVYLDRQDAINYLLEDGDILLARSGATVGKSFLYKMKYGEACFAGYLIRVRLNRSKILPDFFYYYTKSKPYWDYISLVTIQATIQNVNGNKYSNLFIPLPTIDEQKTIIKYLDNKTTQINNQINLKKKSIHLLKEKRQSIINQSVTIGLKSNQSLKRSGIQWVRDIPQDWKIKKMKFTTFHKTERSPKQSNLTYVGLENIEPETGKLISINDEMEESDAKKFLKNEILFGKLRPYLAKVWLADFDGRCSGEFLVLKAKEYFPGYLKFLLLSDGFIKFVDSSTYGAKMPRIEWDFIGNMKLPLPPFNLQIEIATFLSRKISKIEKNILLNNQLIRLLKEKRLTIINQAVTTGQILS